MTRLLALLVLMFSAPLLAQDAELAKAKAEMESLASTGVREALKVVHESGGFYPFGLVMDDDEKVRLVGYRGRSSAKPPADEYVTPLFWRMRQTVNDEKNLRVAMVLKPHTVTSREGVAVPGIWATVDHRHAAPWVMFLPFLPQDDGTYQVGEIVYSSAQEGIFNLVPKR